MHILFGYVIKYNEKEGKNKGKPQKSYFLSGPTTKRGGWVKGH